MANDEQWEIWYRENCRIDFENRIYKECDIENLKLTNGKDKEEE